MAENKNIEVGSRLHSIATGNVLAGANEIFDDDKNKKQSQINTETYSLVEEINAKLNTLSPNQQAALDVAGKANNNETKLGYYVCDTEGNVAAKVIPNITGYVLSVGGSMKVKMTNANTADNATLNINSTGAKALYYDCKRASATNSWKAGETVEVYYDGTSYYANSVVGGMVTSEKIATSSFDSTLSVSGKIAPANVVGGKLTELDSKTDQQFSQLKQLINGGYLFKGIVTPSSDVITTDNKIFVVASEVGTYTNFGGYVVTKGELAFLYYDTEWHKGSVEVAVEEEEILATDEDGFAIMDEQLQVGMKYDKNGFDIAKIADHAKEMLESRLYNGAFASVNEDGLFVVDENLNIGVKVDNAGVHAPNILEYEIINK